MLRPLLRYKAWLSPTGGNCPTVRLASSSPGSGQVDYNNFEVEKPQDVTTEFE